MLLNLHRSILSLANVGPVRHWVTHSRLTRSMVRRFVAGESVDDAVAVAVDLQASNINSALDLLGENVTETGDAVRSADEYVGVLRATVKSCVRSPYISVKLTALGLDISGSLAEDNLRKILAAATVIDQAFVRVDMEASRYTQSTIDIVKRVHQDFKNVGIVLQSYLYRTDDDVRDMVERGIAVRLVKGAYAEDATVAYPRKSDVDDAYVRQLGVLLGSGVPAAVASHDLQMIHQAKRLMREGRLDNGDVEFQLLYGIRPDIRDGLAAEGYRVRTYIPFGSQWYPYFVRRLAERPANVGFLVRSELAARCRRG